MEKRPGVFSGRVGLTFLSPALVFVAIFLILPFFWIFYLSFTNRTLTGITAAHPEFVGFENYQRLFDFDRWMRYGQFGNGRAVHSLGLLPAQGPLARSGVHAGRAGVDHS